MTELEQLNEILPIPEPMTSGFSRAHFYNSTLKLLVKPCIAMCENGITLDMPRVYQLDQQLTTILDRVHTNLASNPAIQEFQSLQYNKAKSTYKAEQRAKKRSLEYYLKPLDLSKMDHRSYVMNYLTLITTFQYTPTSQLPDGSLKWTQKDVKLLAELQHDIRIEQVLDKSMRPDSPTAQAAMRMLAITKANLWNNKYQQNIDNPPADLLPPFNPGSTKQKTELFDYYQIPPISFSKDTGAPSWGRSELVELSNTLTNPTLKEAVDLMIEYSQGAIVKNNFVKGFIDYSIEGNLKSNIKLFGTKTMRPTSGGTGYLNFLNMPSTGSKFSKPIKECIIARPGFIQLSSDYSSLEDKVISCLSKDTNKIITQTDSELDAHLFHATIYFRDQFTAILGDLPHRELTIAAKAAMDDGNKEIKTLRQTSKGVTFGASYGAFPQKIADSIGCSLEEGEKVFNAYHNDMYPGITKWRDEVTHKANQQGEIEMGLGAKIKSDNINKDTRTLFNSQSQFWSILTLIALAKLHFRIQEANLQHDVLIVNTIYDAIYLEVRNEPSIIKWANEALVACMNVDFLENQIVPNDADCELSFNLSNPIVIPKTATLDQIQATIKQLKEN